MKFKTVKEFLMYLCGNSFNFVKDYDVEADYVYFEIDRSEIRPPPKFIEL